MKYGFYYLILFAFVSLNVNAQTMEAEINQDGIVVPRVDRTVTTGVEGQLIYDINTNSFWYHDGTVWLPISGSVTSSSSQIIDADGDTSVEVERTADSDQIVAQVDGTDALVIKKNANGDILFDIANTSGFNNTFIGYQAGIMNSTGMDNVIIGSEAGIQNDNGLSNTIIGSQAGQKNVDGESNVYIGFQAGQNAEALVNTMIGNKAGQMTTSGFSNVFLGSTAGNFNETGEQNAYLGSGAGFFNGGSFNTFVGNGAGAGSLPLSSTGNIFLGYFAGSQETGDSLLYIDNSSSNTPLIWGNFKQGAKEVRVNGDFCYTGALLACSDVRFKNNIQPISNALSRLTSLQGVKHDWKHDEFDNFVWSANSEYGVLAQEVEAVFPELVSEDDKGYKYVNYTKFTPIVIEAMKEQQDQIESLQKENQALRSILLKHEALLKDIASKL